MNYSPCNGFTLSQVKLINLFRKLWEQYDVWTRPTIISIAFGLADLTLVIRRLLRNPVGFGHAFDIYYGYNIASQFSSLLREHLVLAAQIVEASKTGDMRTAAEADKRLYLN